MHTKNKAKAHDEMLCNTFAEKLNSKYDKEKALSAVERIIRHGGTQAELASELNVVSNTIVNWKTPSNKAYKPEFAEAFLLAKYAGLAYWDKLGRMQVEAPIPNFNYNMYVYERKRLHRITNDRTVKLPQLLEAKTFAQQVGVLRVAVSKGEITPQEFKILIDGLSKAHEIIEMQTLKQENLLIREEVKKLQERHIDNTTTYLDIN